MLKKLVFILCLCAVHGAFAQMTTLEGYVYESKNRGYLNQVKVMVLESSSGIVKAETETNKDGFFTVEIPAGVEYRVGASKGMFLPKDESVVTTAGEKSFVKIEMNRKPGYLMDITLAEKRIGDLIPVDGLDGLNGVRFEVYNNTTEKEVFHNDSTSSTNVQFQMEQGNHYTYLIRKKGYFSKRVEAYVNVKGCILCIDGIDNVTPGVTDNLTSGSGFKEGVLLANLELQPLKVGNSIKINNIYYDLGSAALRPESKKELDKLTLALRDNPYINVELGSHTDARGDLASNLNLSQRRAESVVEYLVRYGKIDEKRLTAQGYGEGKLVNRCADGVQCAEDEHQVNRRTELKILSIDENKIMEYSLPEIIRNESMEKTVQEIQKSDVIEVKEGEAMPDDLKRYIEEQNKGKQEPKPTPPPAPKTEKTRIDFKKTNEQTKTEVKNEEKTEVKTVVEEKIATPTITETVEKAKKVETPVVKNNSKMVVEKEVKTSTSTKKVQTLATDYSGYMVEILSNPKPLGGTNEIFSRFDNITIEASTKNVIYYAGSFQKLVDVEQFYVNEVRTRYPKAEIVRFVKGKRVK